MKRALACALVFVGCASSAAPGAGPVVVVIGGDAGAPPPRAEVDAGDGAAGDAAIAGDLGENRRIAKMMKIVSRARGLASLHAVPGAVLPRTALLDRIKSHVAKEIPPEVIRNEGLELKILGFVPTSFDYLAATYALLDAQLAGFYEPADGTMYLAADLGDDNADATLAHELDHALQDQHFDLKAHAKYEPGKSDAQEAYDALAEGDATSTMIDVLIAKAAPGKTALDLPPEAIEEQMTEAVSAGDAVKAPRVMRTSLVAPYVYGTTFVNELRRGGGWAGVDAAWNALPTTTEQILHVDKWRAHEPALDVSAPTFAALGSGWKAVDEDSSGELGMRLAFEEWMGTDAAKRAARGWGGDRDVLLENGALSAFAVHVRYDANRTMGGADDPFALLATGLPASVGKPAAKDAAWVCVQRAQLGPLGVMKRGQELVIVAGPAKVDGAMWSAAGDCELAKKWAREITAEK